jgi:hypothetical protein
MELEQHHVFKFLHLKGLKLGDIAVELSSLYGQDAYARSRIKHWLHQLRLGRKNLTTQDVSGDRLSTIPTVAHCEGSHAGQRRGSIKVVSPADSCILSLSLRISRGLSQPFSAGKSWGGHIGCSEAIYPNYDPVTPCE